MKRKNIDAPSEADAGPTNAITCSHGELMPEQAPGAKRILVPENLWSFLVEDALKVTPEDTLGCQCFPLDSIQCSHCTSELSEVAGVEDALRLTIVYLLFLLVLILFRYFLTFGLMQQNNKGQAAPKSR